MDLTSVDADALPALDVPLSHAVVHDGLVHCSGQVPITSDGQLVAGDMAAQTRQVLDNLEAVLAAAGSSLARVIRTTVYLTDLAAFGEMNAAYADRLTHRPARTCIQVAGLPLGASVEIDCIASAGGDA